MGFWTKFFGRALQLFLAGELGYEIKNAIDAAHDNQILAQTGSVAQKTIEMVVKQRAELKEVEESLNATIILMILTLAGVGFAVIIGVVAAVYAVIAKKTSKKIKTVVRDLER